MPNFLAGRIPVITVASSTTFDSVSYTAFPDGTPGDRTVPEYDEIIDKEEEPSKVNDSLVPAQAQSDSNHYCSTPQPPGNNHGCSIVSLLFIRSSILWLI